MYDPSDILVEYKQKKLFPFQIVLKPHKAWCRRYSVFPVCLISLNSKHASGLELSLGWGDPLLLYFAELWPREQKDITQGKNLFREVLARVMETVSTGPLCCLVDI